VFLALVVLVEADGASVTANISGMKFNDLNDNGMRDPGELGLGGWQIDLSFTNGTIYRTTTTAADGSYNFTDVPSGSYIVQEILQPGWTQTVPVPPGIYTVTLSGTDVTSLDFGNFRAPAPTPTPTPTATPIATVTATTPAPTTPAPTTPAPIVTTPAPVVTTPQPVVTTPAPIVTTPAPTALPTTPLLTPTPSLTETPTTTAPTTTTPSPMPTQIDTSKIVEDELKKLATGQIFFNPSQEMSVGETERVEVRLTRVSIENLSRENLTQGTRGRGEPQIENISVGAYMKVRLMGDNFDIKALSDEEQLVPSEGFTQWEFDVTPLESGAQKLQLAVAVRIKISNDGEEKRDYPVYEKLINVKVNPVYSAGKFMEINWQWILTTIIGLSGAIIGWIINKKRKSGKKGRVSL
jgi:hypothetical protein